MTLLIVTSINVEGYTRIKADVLADSCNGRAIVSMQENYLGQTSNQLALPGMKVVAEIHHHKYGSAMFMKPLLDSTDTHTNSSDTNIDCYDMPIRDLHFLVEPECRKK